MRQLHNPVRPYAWGSATAIPQLLGLEPTGEPHAELWLGAHPDSPSSLIGDGGAEQPLDEAIEADPDGLLGDAYQRFGARLPFLMKVLAADQPLSLQVHPDADQARAGFEQEERRGVPRAADHRRYKDPFHKPELICALTAFEALCGFRDPAQAAGILESLSVAQLGPVLDDLVQPDGTDALRSAFTRLVRWPADERDDLVQAAAEAARRCVATGSAYPLELAIVVELADRYPGDPGVLISVLLNRVTLQPGAALFLPAGNVHAYLRGVGVEIMASSDNVLRGGLTPKNIALTELLAVVDFRASAPPFITPRHRGPWDVFEPPVEEFQLARVTLGPEPATIACPGPRILLCTAGEATLRAESDTTPVRLASGGSVFVPDQDGPVSLSGTGEVFVASVPETTSGSDRSG